MESFVVFLLLFALVFFIFILLYAGRDLNDMVIHQVSDSCYKGERKCLLYLKLLLRNFFKSQAQFITLAI